MPINRYQLITNTDSNQLIGPPLGNKLTFFGPCVAPAPIIGPVQCQMSAVCSDFVNARLYAKLTPINLQTKRFSQVVGPMGGTLAGLSC